MASRSPRQAWLLSRGRDVLHTVLPALLIALLVHLFLAQSTIVFGKSMEPNLHDNERLIVEKLSYRWHAPQRGDIVIVPDPDGGALPLIKRVIGLPGERVTVASGKVYIDGEPLDEPYLDQPTPGSGQTWTVPPLHVFLMGDNRRDSRDSRLFGPVSSDQITGHAIFGYWPLADAGGL